MTHMYLYLKRSVLPVCMLLLLLSSGAYPACLEPFNAGHETINESQCSWETENCGGTCLREIMTLPGECRETSAGYCCCTTLEFEKTQEIILYIGICEVDALCYCNDGDVPYDYHHNTGPDGQPLSVPMAVVCGQDGADPVPVARDCFEL